MLPRSNANITIVGVEHETVPRSPDCWGDSHASPCQKSSSAAAPFHFDQTCADGNSSKDGMLQPMCICRHPQHHFQCILDLTWLATNWRIRFFTNCAILQKSQMQLVPYAITSAAKKPVTYHEGCPVEDLLLKRLEDLQANPGWLASDEADIFLQHMRWKLPYVQFAPPALWCDRRNILLFFKDLCPDLKTHANTVLLILVNHHWIAIHAEHTPRKLQLEITAPSTFSEVLHPLCHLIAGRAGYAPQDIEVHRKLQEDIPNMCGWKILLDLRQRFLPHHQLPEFRCLTSWRLACSTQATQAFPASVQTCTDDIDLIQLAKTTRVCFLHSVLENRIAINYQAAGKQTPAGQPAQASNPDPKGQDPLWIQDPWAKRRSRPQYTRWEDLLLDASHPFQDSANKQIEQTDRYNLRSKRLGVLATKSTVPELAQIKTLPTCTNPSSRLGCILTREPCCQSHRAI